MSEQPGVKKRKKGDAARDKIRVFLENNVGKIVTTGQIAEVAHPVKDYPRRIRELRGDEGMQILSYKDRHDLKPSEYILASLERVPRFSHRIDKAQRARILERDGFTCGMCGAAAGEPDPYQPKRKITLQVDHVDPDGQTTDENLRALCHNCNEGRSNLVTPPTPNTLSFLRTIRRLSRADQRLIYDKLKEQFEPDV
ncbi:MAG: HNH endonuclease [Thermodesulfovibrionales bacterium]